MHGDNTSFAGLLGGLLGEFRLDSANPRRYAELAQLPFSLVA
jgi:hypothetical protein